MPLTGWGKNFSIFSNVYNPVNNDEIINIILKDKISNFITRGLGRSYGDSSLADNITLSILTSYIYIPIFLFKYNFKLRKK